MFQFTGLPFLPYGFRQEYARITVRGFPHSDIPGSMDGQLLTRAYRSRPRPSSAPGAKAFTVCPLSLDHEEHRVCRYGVFKVRAGESRSREKPAEGRSLKTQQRGTPRSTFDLGEPGHRTTIRSPVPDLSLAPRCFTTSTDRAPAGVGAPASLERR